MKNQIRRGSVLFAAVVSIGFVPPVRAEYVEPNIRHAQYGEVKVLVPITSDDPSVWLFRLRNVGNGIKAISGLGGNMQAKIVLYGAGVKMLSQPVDPKLKEAIDAARAAGAQFNVCNVTLKGMKLDWHTLYGLQEGDIVPSGFAEVGWLATNGWVVNPAN
ncbi:DsrE family protein [Duganella qianjiadongensis]|uniref:DsrE/DsrF-like family protein n=1 Tax=Duganella qianjiadongensis TaxID=2692176 RepID=A0ABW9VF72_9BURK|nr:DsrE family protein [Duganella qianjiadongensis]MYM37737.1 hypothetical protein [Duganella qianjiadongensis]